MGTDILDEEARALRKINPGPGHWIQPCDWWLLKESWGHSMAFVSARHKSMAAATRIALTDALDFRSKVGELNCWITECEHLGRRGVWKNWFDSSFFKYIADSYDHLMHKLALNPKNPQQSLPDSPASSKQSFYGEAQTGKHHL